MVMRRLTLNGIAEPILPDQILRCEPRQGNIQFLTRGREFSYFSFYIREKVLRICVSREGSQNIYFHTWATCLKSLRLVQNPPYGLPLLLHRLFATRHTPYLMPRSCHWETIWTEQRHLMREHGNNWMFGSKYSKHSSRTIHAALQEF